MSEIVTSQIKQRAVFLDRDGVIIRSLVLDGKPYPPKLAEVVILPGVLEALTQLKAAGFRLIVVTNQPDVARGTETREAVEEIHALLGAQLPIDQFRACFHDNTDECHCRKPKPGMLLDAAQEFGIDLARSFMVGDRWRDVEAGQRAGCTSIFIDYHYSEVNESQPDVVVGSLLEAATWILSQAN